MQAEKFYRQRKRKRGEQKLVTSLLVFFCKHEHVFLIFTLLHVTSSRFGLYLVIFTTLITHFHRHI